MDAFFSNVSRKKINITILATYPLVRQSLRLILDSHREFVVLDSVRSNTDLLSKIQAKNPDIILLCLMRDEGKNIEVLKEAGKLSPQSKSVILFSPDSLLDQTAALSLGVAGIIEANQGARALIQAIKQVAEGEVWLNQKLLAQLLDNNFKTPKNKHGNKNFLKADELTKREIEVVGMIGLGMNNKSISKSMFISEATVRHHLSSIYSKLHIEDRLNLAIYAHRRQIVRFPANLTA